MKEECLDGLYWFCVYMGCCLCGVFVYLVDCCVGGDVVGLDWNLLCYLVCCCGDGWGCGYYGCGLCVRNCGSGVECIFWCICIGDVFGFGGGDVCVGLFCGRVDVVVVCGC